MQYSSVWVRISICDQRRYQLIVGMVQEVCLNNWPKLTIGTVFVISVSSRRWFTFSSLHIYWWIFAVECFIENRTVFMYLSSVIVPCCSVLTRWYVNSTSDELSSWTVLSPDMLTVGVIASLRTKFHTFPGFDTGSYAGLVTCAGTFAHTTAHPQ